MHRTTSLSRHTGLAKEDSVRADRHPPTPSKPASPTLTHDPSAEDARLRSRRRGAGATGFIVGAVLAIVFSSSSPGRVPTASAKAQPTPSTPTAHVAPTETDAVVNLGEVVLPPTSEDDTAPSSTSALGALRADRSKQIAAAER